MQTILFDYGNEKIADEANSEMVPETKNNSGNEMDTFFSASKLLTKPYFDWLS